MAQPVRCDDRQGVERVPERFAYSFQAIEGTDGGQHMGGIGALATLGLQELAFAKPVQERLKQKSVRRPGQQDEEGRRPGQRPHQKREHVPKPPRLELVGGEAVEQVGEALDIEGASLALAGEAVFDLTQVEAEEAQQAGIAEEAGGESLVGVRLEERLEEESGGEEVDANGATQTGVGKGGKQRKRADFCEVEGEHVHQTGGRGADVGEAALGPAAKHLALAEMEEFLRAREQFLHSEGQVRQSCAIFLATNR